MPSGGHNFHTGAPIDAPFMATRSSHHPLRFYLTFEGILGRARTMNHHPHGRMKVLWAWLEAMEGVDGAIASLRMHEEYGLGLVKIKDPAGIDSALHRVDSQGFVWDKMSFEALRVDSGNFRVNSKMDRDQILLPGSRFRVARIDSNFQNVLQRGMRIDSGNARVDYHVPRILNWCSKALQSRL
ncbi:hypothetical protein PIB30_050809 [Stylosanthes scabra]|uniref:Uncharacterized protein n=1 Tax=Stylosanthes scabra TaxID=79078 RepID=A0ABU6SJA1_9FABA|nr:hypothetical protein [Stylosanthes scabra]